MNIFIDIETIPTQDENIITQLHAGVQAPGTMSKQDTIDKWFAEKGEEAKGEAVAKTSFNGGLGQIFCIGLAFDDEDPIVINRNCLSPESEKTMLEKFNEAIGATVEKTYKQPYFIGHNISGFDLRFIYHRMIVLGVKPKFIIPVNDAAYKNTYFDTMCEWAGYKDRVSLDNLCKYLDIKSPKTDLDGSKVWEYVRTGRGAEVVEYCKVDVAATREVYKRLTFDSANI